MTVVYVDTVFLLNGVLDYLLLLSAARLASVSFQRIRLIGAALLGGCYAVAVFLPGAAFLSWPSCRLLFGGIMVAAAFGVRRGMLRLLALFFALSCVLAGILVMVTLFWQVSVSYPRGVPVTGMDWKALLLAGALCYGLSATLLRRIAPDRGSRTLPVCLHWGGRQTGLTVLADSGNLLSDPSGLGPVLVAEWEAVLPVLPAQPRLTRADLTDPVQGMERIGTAWGNGRLHLLAYQGLGEARGLLLAVRMDSAEIDRRIVQRQLVALSPGRLSDGSYQGVIRVEE